MDDLDSIKKKLMKWIEGLKKPEDKMETRNLILICALVVVLGIALTAYSKFNITEDIMKVKNFIDTGGSFVI